MKPGRPHAWFMQQAQRDALLVYYYMPRRARRSATLRTLCGALWIAVRIFDRALRYRCIDHREDDAK